MKTTTRQPEGSLKTISLAHLLAHQFPVREHLVAPWLRQGESAMLWASSGLGKTMLSLSLALAVAGGGELLGWRSDKPRNVLFVDGEMSIIDLQERLQMLSGTIDGCDLAAAGRNLTVLSRQHQGADVRFPDLATEDGRTAIVDQARALDTDLIILDNFSTLAEVADENEAAAMSPVLAFLLRLKQEGRACILVHHSGKSGETFRGSSKLATTFEVIIGLKPVNGHRASAGTAFSLEWTKYRGTPTASTRPFEATLPVAETGAKWASRAALSEEISQLVEAVESCRYGTQDQVAEALGWDKSKVSKVKTKAIAANAITREQWDGCLSEGMTGGFEGPRTADF